MAWKNVQYKNGKMRTSEDGGGSSTFADLEDVNLTNPQNGQVPKYNATTEKWENADESGGTVTDVLVNGQSVVNPQTGEARITSYKEVTRAQYEALPDSKLTDGILYCIKDESRGADSFPPLIYSDEEREIGVWTDGKPLYQKTIHIVENTEQSDKVYQTEITSLNPDYIKLVNAEIKLGVRGNNRWYTAPFTVNTSYYMGVSVCNFEMEIISNTWQYSEAYVTIQYTKTTDVAGSGIWNTDGSFAHHYSTQEKVVGTWIDGSTIYEKVVSGLSYTASSQWNSTGITIQGLDKVISCKFAQVQNSELLSFVDYFICKNDGNGNVQAWGTSSNTYTYQVALIQYTKSTT